MTSQEIRLGRYILQRKLGEGNYAEVWLAQDAFLERPVALKLLKPVWMTDAEARARFLREARVLANLHHPRIAWVWDLGEEQGRAFIAMRYVEGISLDRLIQQKGRLEWEEALRIVAEAGEGLEFAHRKGLVHRDIKPQNILVSAEDGVVLTDFGLVRALEGSEMATRSSVMMGTPFYMAPEIWSGQAAGPGVDQYALACVLVEMLTGHPLFEAPNTPAIMMKHFQPAQLPSDLPVARRDALAKALSKEPEQRWAGVGEWIQALRVVPAAVVMENTPPAVVEEPKVVLESRSIGAKPKVVIESQNTETEPEAVIKNRSIEPEPKKFAFEPQMVRIPAGEFLMGSTPEQAAQSVKDGAREEWVICEQLQHKVMLKEYAIGKYPITCREYQSFLQDSGRPSPQGWSGREYPASRGDHPVVKVSWEDVQAYCAWLRQKTGKPYCLPSEAEWEKAARGVDGRVYPWGSAAPDKSRCNIENWFRDTTPVGKFSPLGDSPYGCVDMIGNVWEWCADWFDELAYAHRAGKLVTDPRGPDKGTYRSIRGGSWADTRWFACCAFRYGLAPGNFDRGIGFRVVLSLGFSGS